MNTYTYDVGNTREQAYMLKGVEGSHPRLMVACACTLALEFQDKFNPVHCEFDNERKDDWLSVRIALHKNFSKERFFRYAEVYSKFMKEKLEIED